MNSILTFKEAIKLVETLRKKGKKFVLTNGCFDILHLGHILYLRKAKKLADCLIVAIDSDKNIKRLKGKNRPIQNETSRLEILSELKSVDYVFLFDDMMKVLELIKPEIYAKGGNYTLDTMNQQERRLIESYGGKVYIIETGIKSSSTKLTLKLKNGF